jgi:hypothetical protein|tara:strand:- start:37 stop:243 length:207 start_codon:yes stop_codon:yes gene_type:complete
MHHSNRQGPTQAEFPMPMAVHTAQVFLVILGMRVCMHVSHSALMLMNVEVDSLRLKFSEDISTEKHEH